MGGLFAMTLKTGQILNNRYRIVKRLTEGGFGAIYRVWDINLKKVCALKENLEISPEAQRQFEREAVILAGLHHPNLPRVTDHFTILGQGQYLVMDFIEGEDLQEMLDQANGSLPESQVLPWIEQVCEALTYLHGQSPAIIHRDIKPANIKISPQRKAVLVDFGVAKQHRPGLKTDKGAQAVTPGYSPLEQYVHGNTDVRSDVYALGATLYTLLTGREPLDSVQRNLNKRLVSPRLTNPAITINTESVVLHALEVSPKDRFQTVSEFKKCLFPPKSAVQFATASPSIQGVQAISAPKQMQPRRGGLKWLWIVIIGLILFFALCICGAAIYIWNYGDQIFGLATIELFNTLGSLS